jgi:FixJ family two-component response regulator
MAPNKRMQKMTTSTQLHEILYTDSQDMLDHLPLHHATITAVQVEVPDSEIMDMSTSKAHIGKHLSIIFLSKVL